mmetsp:Transcript_50869/g.108388  ORF Transcript_50869/g.108388 Transcript_50869/m.108388 type:complete len:97 (+) Transcript_50869:923-1213(+)
MVNLFTIVLEDGEDGMRRKAHAARRRAARAYDRFVMKEGAYGLEYGIHNFASKAPQREVEKPHPGEKMEGERVRATKRARGGFDRFAKKMVQRTNW